MTSTGQSVGSARTVVRGGEPAAMPGSPVAAPDTVTTTTSSATFHAGAANMTFPAHSITLVTVSVS